MTSPKVILGIAGALAVTSAIFGFMQFRSANKMETELSALRQRQETTSARIETLEQEIKSQSERARAVEDDNSTLRLAVEKAEAAKTTATPTVIAAAPLTRQMVEERFNRGRELAKDGDPVEALRELLWCFDTGMTQISSYSGVRASFLLSQIVELGRKHPAALVALRERRDIAQQRLVAGPADGREVSDFTALNRVLGETHLTLAVFDELPAGDRRRQNLANYASEVLLEQRRYKDVMAGKSYATMSSSFELTIQERPLPPNVTNPEALRTANRNFAVTSAAKNVEVLAGSGSLEHARALANRILAFDNSETTQALLLKHATRAGHPGLLAAPAR